MDQGEECDGGAFAHGACSLTCTLACDANFGNCNGVIEDGCEQDLVSSSQNCGACGRDCLGTLCTNGQCEAVRIASGPGGTDPLGRQNSLVGDVLRLYWTGNQGVYAADKSGTQQTATVLATSENVPNDIKVHDGQVYWVELGSAANDYRDGAVWKVAGDGGSAAVLVAGGLNAPRSVSVTADAVYWASLGTTSASFTDGAIESWSATEGRKVLWVSLNTPEGLLVRGQQAYWYYAGSAAADYTDGLVWSAALSVLNAPTTLATGQTRVQRLAADDSALYWIGSGTNAALSKDGNVVKLNLGGATEATALALNQELPVALAVDEKYVYWAGFDDDAIHRIAKDGSETSPSVAVSVQAYVTAMTTDENALYWLDWSNDLFRVGK